MIAGVANTPVGGEAGVEFNGMRQNRAVRLLLQSPAPQQPEHFDLVTFGEGGRFTKLNIDKTSALMEEDDIDRFARLR